MPLQPRDRLGPYEIQALLGVGGMGEVYRGRDTRLGRDVALKVISPARLADADLRRRFELEARAASVLNHPSIVTIYDVGEEGGVSWIAMEWVEGRTLRDVLLEGAISVPRVLSICRHVAEGLAAAHAKGIVHRDLKPENVMLTSDGRAKILDFGLARQTIVDSLESAGGGSMIDTVAGVASEPTVEGAILGTVGYMSPEQASGRPVDFHSDQFSFGLIAYEMVAGQRAFSRPTAVQTLAAIIAEEPPPLASIRGDVPHALQALIDRCLSKRPEDRFPSTREIVVALEFLGTGISAVAPPPVAPATPMAPARRVARRPRLARLVLPAGILVALALAAAAYFSRSGTAVRAADGRIDSLAVLPFANADRNDDAEYLVDGLTENLIDQLSRAPSLRVMARGTVFRFKGTADPLEAGRKLAVGAILTGIVARRGSDLSITAELIDTSTGERLWAKDYDRPLADLLRVQDEIAIGVADGLRLGLSNEAKQAMSGHGTESPEAYELALKARYFFGKDTEEDLLEAIRLYRESIAKDPKYVEAHLGLAASYVGLAVDGYAPPAEAFAKQAEQIQKVIALAPRDVLVRAAVAHRRFFHDWDWTYCDGEYRDLATEMELFRTEKFRPIALYYWARGRTDEAIALMERALRVDPGNRTSQRMRADFLAHAGRLEEAIAGYRQLAESEPSDPRPLYGLADLLRRKGDVSEAIGTLRKAYALSGEEGAANALSGARTAKDYDDAQILAARARLADLVLLAEERYVSPFNLARLQAQAGETDAAFDSLRKALAERSPGLLFLKVDRAWDPIRADPRFAAVVRRVVIP